MIGSSPHWPGGTGISNLRPLAGWISALERGRVQGNGNQYFLTSSPPIDGSSTWAAIWYVAKDRSNAVLFAFRLGRGETSRAFSLPGLFSEQVYQASLFSAGIVIDSTGEALMRDLSITVPDEFQSELVLVEAR